MDTGTSSPDLHRRKVLRGAALGAVTLPVLVACADDGDSPGTSSTTGASTPSESGSATQDGSAGAEVLAEAADIQVGGAVFLDSNIVITQPAQGEFHAFDRTCTHQQCAVTSIEDGKILCPCHGSLYDMETGENVGGPAPSPLTAVDIKVEDGQILRG